MPSSEWIAACDTLRRIAARDTLRRIAARVYGDNGNGTAS